MYELYPTWLPCGGDAQIDIADDDDDDGCGEVRFRPARGSFFLGFWTRGQAVQFCFLSLEFDAGDVEEWQ